MNRICLFCGEYATHLCGKDKDTFDCCDECCGTLGMSYGTDLYRWVYEFVVPNLIKKC